MIFFHGVPVSIVIIEVLSGAADGDDAIIIPIKAFGRYINLLSASWLYACDK
jgi:hypothetical protein